MKKTSEVIKSSAKLTCLLYSFNVITVTSKPRITCRSLQNVLDRLKIQPAELAEGFASLGNCHIFEKNSRVKIKKTLETLEFWKSAPNINGRD